ncbi:hypothetical protein CBOM_07971 [Ceraceosorus bombacis]|uniref:Secreted protein n=1 Tax=Ceraceosorus bombacis TaxID=401625 RepID=A0A0N7LBE3_9BASI|nr:hypothetical protein CBOM_07971 [Ceraceosorus bombacis]
MLRNKITNSWGTLRLTVPLTAKLLFMRVATATSCPQDLALLLCTINVSHEVLVIFCAASCKKSPAGQEPFS